MAQIFENNADSVLNGGITEETTAITIRTGDGALFPSPGDGDWYYVTIFQRDGGKEINHEIMRVYRRVGDVLYVDRAQERKVARSFNNGDPIELRITASMDSNKLTLAEVHAAILAF